MGRLDEKIAHEESVALAAKVAAEKQAEAKKEIDKEALIKKILSESKRKTK